MQAHRTPPSGQRFSVETENLGKNTTPKTKFVHLLLNLLGAILIIGTYVWTILYNGQNISDGSAISLPLVAGYTLGVICLLLGNISRIPTTIIALIPFAAAFNIVFGQIIGFSGIPLYLDTVATVIVGCLAGPAAGVLTGAITNLAWGLTLNPSTIPFAAGASLVGLLAGYAGKFGFFKRFWTATLAGLIVGIIAGIIGAPIAAFVYNGGLGVGTGSLVAILQASGQSMLSATTIQSLLSDPLDKAVAFLLAWTIIKAVPQHVKGKITS